jgi:hypothetical protein
LCLSLILLLCNINGKGKKKYDYLTCLNIHQSIVIFVCFVSVRIFYFYQSWALAHFFEVRFPLPTQFFSLDR